MFLIKRMNNFKFGNSNIDNIISFNSDDLIVIGGRPAMGKTSFALNLLLHNGTSRGCYFSLNDTQDKLEQKIIKIDNPSLLSLHLKELNIETYSEGNFEVIFLDQPKLIDIIEIIVNKKDDFDFFIIDELTYIDKDITPIFSTSKNYQNILKQLKSLAKVITKNIILLSNIDRIIEEVEENKFAFSYYAKKEKYVDNMIILHRPEYYFIEKDENDRYYKKGECKVIFAKTLKEIANDEISLIFNSSNFIFSSK